MKTIQQNRAGFFGLLLLAGTLGLLLLVHFTSNRTTRCEKENSHITLMKLI
jgi:hypothetical protein